jgi:hypothetical protein
MAPKFIYFLSMWKSSLLLRFVALRLLARDLWNSCMIFVKVKDKTVTVSEKGSVHRHQTFKWLFLRASTHYALFGHSFVFSCFISCLLFNDKFFSCFLHKLYFLQTHETMKTLNYGRKVHSVYSPLHNTIFLAWHSNIFHVNPSKN